MELDPEQVKALGLRPGGPKELSAAELKMMGLSPDGPSRDVGEQVLDTLSTTGGGFIKGASEAMNPALAAANMVPIAKGVLNTFPGINMASGLFEKPLDDLQQRLVKAAPKTQGVDIAMGMPWGQRAAQVMNSLGVDLSKTPRSAKEAAAQRGIEMNAAQRILAGAAEGVGAALPYVATGPGAALKFGALSGTLGAAGEEVGGDVGKAIGTFAPLLLAGRAPKSAAPTKESLAAQAKAAYRGADAEGTVISKGDFARFVGSLEPKLVERVFDKDFHPMAFKTYAKMANEAERGNITLKSIESLRSWMNEAKANAKPRDAGIIKIMRDSLDDFVVSMPGAPQYRQAADLYRRQRGLEKIEKLVERAKDKAPTYTAAGYDTALRNEFKRFVGSKEMRFFTKPEQEALTKIARGTPIGNVMRQLGRLAPQNVLHSLLLANVHPAATALTVPGAGARIAASKSTQRNIKLAQDLIASGKPVPPSLRRYLDSVPAALGAYARSPLEQ